MNTPVAEILYNQVVTELRSGLANPGTNHSNELQTASPLLCLDICCGTGTIGIICSKANLGSVVGIEMCPAAVENAKLNAQLNGLKLLNENSTEDNHSENNAAAAAFICSRAETVLENILTNHRRSHDPLIQRIQSLANGKKLLAVVDPPREVCFISPLPLS